MLVWRWWWWWNEAIKSVGEMWSEKESWNLKIRKVYIYRGLDKERWFDDETKDGWFSGKFDDVPCFFFFC